MSTVDLRPADAPDTPPPVDGVAVGGKSAARSLVELGLAVGAVVALSIATGQVDLLIVVAVSASRIRRSRVTVGTRLAGVAEPGHAGQ